jgi:hypothetical protein
MATNDGYQPYPIGLTASQATNAIKRAHDLDEELSEFVKITSSITPPTVLETKTGDLWKNLTTSKIYRASIEGSTLLWFEV